MMGTTHRANGLAVGGVVSAVVRSFVLPAPAPVVSCALAVVCAVLLTWLAGRASLWPDLDHHNSRATNSMGVLSGFIHEFVHSLSCNVFDLTATKADEEAGDFRGHRGLSHFGITAVVMGVLLGVATWALTERRPVLVLGVVAGVLVGLVADRVWTDVVGSLAGFLVCVTFWIAAPHSFLFALVGVVAAIGFLVGYGLLTVPALGVVFAVVSGGAVFYAVPNTAIDWTLVGTETARGLGVGVGLAVMAGMLAHSIGDAATKTGVPLLWPLVIDGRRYYPVHIRPEGFRLHTGEDDFAEMKIRAWSWFVLGIAVLGWWPGLVDVVWSVIPWPWETVPTVPPVG